MKQKEKGSITTLRRERQENKKRNKVCVRACVRMCVRACEIEIDKENDTIFARARKIISFHDKENNDNRFWKLY